MTNAAPDTVKEILLGIRAEKAREIDMIDKGEKMMLKLPEDICRKFCFCSLWIQICSPTREEVEIILGALNAGKWTKDLCESEGEPKIQYNGVVDGVAVCIYSAEPPKSCRIVTEEVYVPAHNSTKRTLICH